MHPCKVARSSEEAEMTALLMVGTLLKGSNCGQGSEVVVTEDVVVESVES